MIKVVKHFIVIKILSPEGYLPFPCAKYMYKIV